MLILCDVQKLAEYLLGKFSARSTVGKILQNKRSKNVFF